MEITKISQLPYKTIIVSIVILIPLVLYSLTNNEVATNDDEETTVSLCQIRVQFDGLNGFDDRTLLSLLATLKMHDFFIGQPVWGPLDTLLYLCEHRLKVGLKQSILDRELHNVIKNGPVSSGRLAWSCA
ncbi:unnamed protein product [Rotaria sp. Silwood1]|nr:unnamed protein product [Rotaria sp. Silwood1]CAF1005568.1 unnamed protein product [Rotaria sp. Silwood1]CAF3397431.1 unnamed protein product [Rotaria sp. Silwood1]CAF3421651.1 unnamed protein product [Rotaria sp. Silwood1]CAF4490628.1 unnamed protein product [Rotaria sp. Silwood1]